MISSIQLFFSRRTLSIWGVLAFVICFALESRAAPFIELPRVGIEPHEIAVVYLEDSEESKALAYYYAHARGVSSDNIFSVNLDADKLSVNPGHFVVEHKVLMASLSDKIQALALAWDQPFQVGCMSMTAAFAFGYDVGHCAEGCQKTRISSYYHTPSTNPWQDFGMRPTMMLAAGEEEANKELIARGIAADDTQPKAKVVLLETSDVARSVRSQFYSEVSTRFSDRLEIVKRKTDAVYDEDNILSYVTGLKEVKGLETLAFVPGALADHLTSAGGRLTRSGQMSAVEWLLAGATASYGTAIEPCNFVEKFPNPVIKLWHYLRGATAIEAYWKSVRMPGQGNFIGEPLAAPYRGYRLARRGANWTILSPTITRGRYRIYGGELGAERFLGEQVISRQQPDIVLRPPHSSSYVLKRVR